MSKAKDEARGEFKILIDSNLTRYGWTKEEVATQICMCPATFYKRLNAPEKFRVGELRKLEKILHLDRKELDEIIDKIAA